MRGHGVSCRGGRIRGRADQAHILSRGIACGRTQRGIEQKILTQRGQQVVEFL